MDKQKRQWEYEITERLPDGETRRHILKGRTASNLDIPPILRKAGIPAGDRAFVRLVTEYSDMMATELLPRCVTSHKVGMTEGCDIKLYDLEQEELDQLMLRILRPFNHNMVKAGLEYGKNSLSKAVGENPRFLEEINDLIDSGWLSPEEEAAIQAELFPAGEPGPDSGGAEQGDAQAPTRDTGSLD